MRLHFRNASQNIRKLAQDLVGLPHASEGRNPLRGCQAKPIHLCVQDPQTRKLDRSRRVARDLVEHPPRRIRLSNAQKSYVTGHIRWQTKCWAFIEGGVRFRVVLRCFDPGGNFRVAKGRGTNTSLAQRMGNIDVGCVGAPLASIQNCQSGDGFSSPHPY
jgi:hypothetical protein